MSDSTLTTQGRTFNQIASTATIGGREYGLALARYNGYENPDAQAPEYIIAPEEWLGSSRDMAVLVGRPPTIAPSANQMVLYGGIALVVLALLLSVSRR